MFLVKTPYTLYILLSIYIYCVSSFPLHEDDEYTKITNRKIFEEKMKNQEYKILVKNHQKIISYKNTTFNNTNNNITNNNITNNNITNNNITNNNNTFNINVRNLMSIPIRHMNNNNINNILLIFMCAFITFISLYFSLHYKRKYTYKYKYNHICRYNCSVCYNKMS